MKRLGCYFGLHKWVRERYGPYLYCQHCRKYNIWRSGWRA